MGAVNAGERTAGIGLAVGYYIAAHVSRAVAPVHGHRTMMTPIAKLPKRKKPPPGQRQEPGKK
jgi:hypothetical protein